MAGIPGAGKSTFVNAAIARGQFPGDSFILDPDRVMTALPEYQHDFEAHGPAESFLRWELPARALAYAMFDEASAGRLTIIKDMGCARSENYEKLKLLKNLGYRLMMFHIACDVDEAIRRSLTRPRHTPPDMIRDRAASLADLLPRYRALADEFTTIKNM